MKRIATLPMYDFPDARDATDDWWAGLSRHLARAGVNDVPGRLLRDDDLLDQWQDPAMLLSQTCSYILGHHLQHHARPIAVPCYTAPGCAGPDYCSVIVVRDDHPGTTLADFRDSRAIYSRAYSHAGYNIFRSMIAQVANGRRFFSSVSSSGSHIGSIDALTTGQADIATIDCLIHAFMIRHRPHLLTGTRSIGFSPPAPAPPYIVPVATTDDMAERIASAIGEAAADPDFQATRDALMLARFSSPCDGDTGRINAFEDAAIAAGYPDLL